MDVKKNVLIIIAVLAVLGAGYLVYKKFMAAKGNPEDFKDLKAVKMSFKFEKAYMPFKYVLLEISGTGEAIISYELYEEYVRKNIKQSDTIKAALDEAEVRALANLHGQMGFFDIKVNDLNKDKITVTDVGTTTLNYSNGKKERTIAYGYVEDVFIKNLAAQYMKLAKRYLPNIK